MSTVCMTSWMPVRTPMLHVNAASTGCLSISMKAPTAVLESSATMEPVSSAKDSRLAPSGGVLMLSE